MKSSSVYTLETADEKKMRMGITAGLVAIFLLVGYFLLPLITKTIHNWIDFGIEVGKLFIMIGVVGTIFLMRNVLIARWKSAIRKMTRFLIKTDLPGLLEVVVANRRGVLAKFNVSIKKMMEAISLHTTKMEERKESMQKNLEYAAQFTKQSNNADAELALFFFREAAINNGILVSTQTPPTTTIAPTASRDVLPGATMAKHVAPAPSRIHAAIFWDLLFLR